MKASFHIIIIPFTLTGMLMAGVAFGNPVMLPQHPGYPMGKATDPVNGQSLANDPGRANAVGEKALNGFRKTSRISDSWKNRGPGSCRRCKALRL